MQVGVVGGRDHGSTSLEYRANETLGNRTAQGAEYEEEKGEEEEQYHGAELYDPSTAEVPDDVQLAEFKSQVRMYIEMDNAIKKLQLMLKDRRTYKQQLADKMVKFMVRFNIEDLDTPDGCISSRVSYTKSPLSQKQIRENIAAYFARQNIPDVGLQLTDALFNDRERVEQVRLRRRRN